MKNLIKLKTTLVNKFEKITEEENNSSGKTQMASSTIVF